MQSSSRFLITAALPYANGPLHLGHIAGVYLPADIYARHCRLLGRETLFVSGSDEHGVAIIQNAQKANQDYQSYVDSWHQEHKNLFQKFGISFDFFGQTSADYHHRETKEWFKALDEKSAFEKRGILQLQCQSCSNWLPDRFVEGTCYVCGYKKARGDECPDCGTWIEPLKLIEPVCQFCGGREIESREVTQWYLKLSSFQAVYEKWLEGKSGWRKTVYSYLQSLAKEGLPDRAITRDLDWGVDVPLEEAENKKLYVWFDAPIGYVSNTKEYLKQNGLPEQDYQKWWQNPDTQISNFIGKDNIIFHGIIFPLMSLISEKANPVDELPANQYLNFMGKQFSKSQGHYVETDKVLEEFGVTALRYYLCTLIPENSDSSFDWQEFEARVNGELANNIGNFLNRSLKFANKNFAEGFSDSALEQARNSKVLQETGVLFEEMKQELDCFNLKKALDKALKIGHTSNEYFSEQAPWGLLKTDPAAAEIVLAASVFLGLQIGLAFSPFLPELSEQLRQIFLVSEESWKSGYQRPENLFGLGKDKLKIAGEIHALVPKILPEQIERFRN